LVDRRGDFVSKIHNCVSRSIEEEYLKELDTVVVNNDIPDHGIKRGDIGVMTLRSEDVRLMKRDEILHVRELHTA